MTFAFGTFAFAQSSYDLKAGMPKAPENICLGIFGPANDPSGACKNRQQNDLPLQQQIRNIVTSVNNFLFVLAPSIAVIAIIIGAFNILQNGFKAGVLIIQWALIGMVVVLLSSALVSVIVNLAVGK
jgi:hypothetical protein